MEEMEKGGEGDLWINEMKIEDIPPLLSGSNFSFLHFLCIKIAP